MDKCKSYFMEEVTLRKKKSVGDEMRTCECKAYIIFAQSLMNII